MESGTIFYIIAVIIYFIYSFLAQKKAQNQETGPIEGEDNPEEAPSRKSFEELLEDIRSEQGERERDLVVTGEKATQKKESTPVPPPEPSERRKQDIYQDLNQGQPLVKLDDQVDIHDDEKILGEVESDTSVAGFNPYGRMLKNPKSLREAIVLSEILQKRHF
ncbi:hypothetical protein [Pleomorphovibrio marinus]|uniref:hypothetical protein n=1 Tax=Pleomorphovibrio marinus TaxID=2164132 RepID=UPI00130035F6|nr:hypothetical protein [Pleomorphovibrio marinus]